MDELTGYRGEAFQALKKFGVEIGAVIKIATDGDLFEGTLMPRYELADDKHIVIKLKNGYNVGIRISPNIKIERVGVGTVPAFVPPPLPKERPGLPEVAVISTGGTIASRVDYRTGAVHPAISASDLYSVVPELSEIAKVRAEVLFSLYSENIQAKHWTKMAETTASYIRGGVNGVVICHGTDTMAYTSAALSFALQNLPVPVVLVGSQRSSDRPSSDAAMNLINAVVAAGNAPLAEVVIGMHESPSDTATLLHRGTKVRKCHTSRRDAFRSINVCPLARIEAGKITMLTENYTRRDSERKLALKPRFNEKVALIKFHPLFDQELIEWHLNNGYKGVILEGTGLGHVRKHLLPSIKESIRNGMIVCMTSQCLWGRVNMNVYDVGRDLQKIGVVPLEDMLPETALVKTAWVLAQTSNVEEARKLLLTNMVGEFSSRTLYEGW